MFQIIINHFGLSLGETQAISNLFSKYDVDEGELEPDYEYASILEIEFIKDKRTPFFEFIPMDKWSNLIEIIKNVKKRRGKKGLRFKSTIADVHKLKNRENVDGPITIKKKTVFTLTHKDNIDFNKGLERIEITIENTVEANEFQTSNGERDGANKESAENRNQNKSANTDLDSVNFIYDETKRKWVKPTGKNHVKE